MLGRGSLPPDLARHAGGLWARAGEMTLIFGLASVIMAMGLVDDRVGLGWKLRLGVQIGLAAILVASGARVTLFWPFNSCVDLGGDHDPLGGRADERLQLPRQHGRAGGGGRV